MRGGQVMSALDFIKSYDTSDVVLGIRKPLRGKMPLPGLLRADWFLGESMVLKLKEKDLAVVTGKKGKSSGKKDMVSVAGGSSERSSEEPAEGNVEDVYVPNWQVKVGDNFKSSNVCEDLLNHFSPPTLRSSNSTMQDDVLISCMLLGVCNLAAMLPKWVSRFRKRMHEYEEFSKKREKTKASMAAMKKEIGGF
ncbi:hypothetical protein Hanom_Chr14g01247581 [Helianthus anomalus]